MTDEQRVQSLKAKCVVTDSNCWEWQGSRNALGYGQATFGGERWMVHRLMYTLLVGPIPDGKQACHSCDHPPCANPAHLWLGTARENALDSKEKCRHFTSSKTHCVRGHPLSGDNLHVSRKGKRTCRICQLAKCRLDAGWPAKLAYTLPKQRLCRKLVGFGTEAPVKRGPTNKIKTHCKRGHELAGENLYVKPNGERQCRACRHAVIRRIAKERAGLHSNGSAEGGQ